ncbi:MAG: hypothetical protein Q9227_006414 [Pyrenula ochraceoflavens]
MGNHHKVVPESDPRQAPQHDHSGHHDDAATFTETNRQFWDQKASSYNAPGWQQNLARTVTDSFHANISWFGISSAAVAAAADPSGSSPEGTSPYRPRILDYACGPGTMTTTFRPFASEIIGIDISANMTQRYNEVHSKAEAGKPSCHAIQGDLFVEAGPSESTLGPEYYGFDMAIVGFGFHHFSNLKLCTERLGDRLKAGGLLVVVDFVAWEKENEGEYEARKTISHRGFTEKGMRRLFGDCGLVDVGWWVFDKPVKVEWKVGGGHEHGNGHGHGNGEGHRHGHANESSEGEVKAEDRWVCVMKGKKPEA